MQEITPQVLQERRAEGFDPLLLDVREDWEYQHARIGGTLHIPMGQIPGRYRELATDKPLVVICHHGMRSAQVAAYLEHMGFADIYNLSGGIDAWSREVDTSIPVY